MIDLKKLIEKEDDLIQKTKNPDGGFDAYELGLTSNEARSLLNEGILHIVYKSNKYTDYRLDRDKIEEILRAQEEIDQIFPQENEAPSDLFRTIIGYEDIKEILLSFIKRGERGGFIFIGPPASAKTLFLMEISRLPGSMYITASSSTKAGVRDILLDDEPRFLCIDELDKANNRDFDALLSLSETGIVQKNVHTIRYQRILNTQVFGAANRDTLPRELKSRYIIIKLKEYTQEELKNVGYRILVDREHVPEDLARYIVDNATAFINDVRDYVKIVRIREDDSIESIRKATDFVLKYR